MVRVSQIAQPDYKDGIVDWQGWRCYLIFTVRSAGRNLLGQVLPILFVVAVPLFLITNSVTWAVNDLSLYRHGFDKYDVSQVTGIEKTGLMAAARQIRGYFNSGREPLEVKARVFGEERELFSQREVLHMRDVKRLIWGVYGIDVIAAVYLLGFTAMGFSVRPRLFASTLSRCLLWGSGLTVALVALVGLIASVGFDSLFLLFHRVSFANDFWMLNPQSDYLVMMFPQGFWFDATLFVALATVVQAAVLAGIAGSLVAFRRWHGHRRQQGLVPSPSKATQL